MNRARVMWVVLAFAGALAACNSTESDWQKASTANTVASYQQFLQQHPNGPHATEARTRLQQLQDEQAWTTAQNANTAEGYQQYLQTEPNGVHAQDARDRLTGLDRAQAWKAAQAEGTPAALQQFLQKYPQGPEADQARAQLQQLDQYVVDLGSYHTRKAAEQARTRFARKFGSVLPNLQVSTPGGKSHAHRVSSAPMSQSDATAACKQLKKAHQHCQVVKRPASAGTAG